MKALAWIATALALVSAPQAVAQEAPQPTAEHQKLSMWIGTWSGSGEMEPGPFGPGGSMNWTEECSWFGGGRFHVVCRSSGTSPAGEMKGLGIIGYDPARKAYTHYGVDNGGWSNLSTGTLTGETWTFTSTETMEGKTYQSRFSMEMTSPTKMSFTWQMSEDGETWTTMMSGVSKKQ